MATEQHKSMSCYIGFDETEPQHLASKEKARKPNKKGSSGQKKKPQRGMGVAQLERLRLQTHFQYQYSNHFPSLPDPIPSVPVIQGLASCYGVPSVGGVAGGAVMGLDHQALLYQTVGNCGGGSGHADPYRVAGDAGLRVAQVGGSLAVVEASKELSSIPNLQRQWAVLPDQRCDFCFKKKRFNGDNIGFNGGRDKYADFSPICNNNGHDNIPQLKQENNVNFNGGNGIKSFGARAARTASYASHHNNINEGLGLVAVHRNGNSSMGRNVLMEYEFFPAGKGGRSTSPKEVGLLPVEASVAVVGGEASYITSSAYDDNNDAKAASSSVDLSLKLSY